MSGSMVLLLMAALAAAARSRGTTPAKPTTTGAGAMTFIVINVHGSARGGRYNTTVVGVTGAATPEQAVDELMPEYAKKWVLSEPTRSDTYARFEDPISFVSDKISYLAAREALLARFGPKPEGTLLEHGAGGAVRHLLREDRPQECRRSAVLESSRRGRCA